jgi:hypothetical protein
VIAFQWTKSFDTFQSERLTLITDSVNVRTTSCRFGQRKKERT